LEKIREKIENSPLPGGGSGREVGEPAQKWMVRRMKGGCAGKTHETADSPCNNPKVDEEESTSRVRKKTEKISNQTDKTEKAGYSEGVERATEPG